MLKLSSSTGFSQTGTCEMRTRSNAIKIGLSVWIYLIALHARAESNYNGPPPKFGPSPRVAISAEELAAFKTSSGFAAQCTAATNAAQPYVVTPIPLPDGYGGWSFDYACPEDGTSLRMISPTEHECPK